jgi:membrane-bound lytic murein transglycosylase B
MMFLLYGILDKTRRWPLLQCHSGIYRVRSRKVGHSPTLGRRGFLKAVAFVSLFPPLIPLISDARGSMKRNTSKTLARGDPYKNARGVLVSEGFDKQYVDALFSDPRMKLYPAIKKVLNRPSESLTYEKYRRVMAVQQKIRDGRIFSRKYADELEEAEKQYRVDGHYIVAIIGAESDYGRNPGKYNPVGVFVTMIERIVHKRSFGEVELVELVHFCQRYDIDPHSLRSSYSGAIGIAQFIPSLLNKLFVDADGDGTPNPTTVVDAIHSIANYLKNHRGYGSGWTLGTKASPGNRNWRSLLAYNNHPNYARAVSEIAEGILQ